VTPGILHILLDLTLLPAGGRIAMQRDNQNENRIAAPELFQKIVLLHH